MTMNPFRTQPAVDAAPRVYYILPEQDAEPPIGPGDLEIEFEFEADAEGEEE